MTHHLGAPELRAAFNTLPEIAHYTLHLPEELICDIRAIRGLQTNTPITQQQANLLTALRGSYARYGSVPAIDEYDTKSCSYMGMIQSQCPCEKAGKHFAAEWHSIRFIPAEGLPDGTDDFALCTTSMGTLQTLLRNKLFAHTDNYQKYMVSITRICATPRYCELDNSELPHRVGTFANFWVTNKTFFDSPGAAGFTHMTGLFRNDLTTRLVTAGTAPEAVFRPAYMELGVAAKDIAINRGLAGYRWPAYFLNLTELTETLTSQLKSNKVSKGFVETALADGFQNFGGTLQAIGPIPHTSLTGEQLRDIVDRTVSDSPILRLFTLAIWKKTVEAQLGMHIV